MIRVHIKSLTLLILFLLPLLAVAQTINGTVKDKDGELLPYVKVTEYRATNNTTSKEDGSFSLRVSMLPTKLVFNSIGYKEVIIPISNKDAVNVTLEKEEKNYDFPVAIKYISMNDIQATGRVSLDDVLAYSEASFNSVNQTHADLTTHFNVADMKGLGSSRMLVLVNGKRKNLSAITHINDTYGKGEVGTDLKSIPIAAIDHIEILREGASSIYGSDAMAGVINIILKKKTDINIVNYYGGITTKGDGLETGGDINGTFSNKNGDYVNYTLGFQHQRFTDRSGEPGKDDVFGIPSSDAWVQDNPDLGMVVGQPRMDTGNAYFNAAKPFKNGKGEIYATIGGEVRKGKSHMLYMAPYMMGTDPFNIYNGNGYQPILKTNIVDNMDVLGVRYNTNGFKIDVSGTFGINSVSTYVDETLNPSMGNDSPKDFDNGKFTFQNAIANLNVTKSFDKLNVIFGAEYKSETYKVKQGEYDSWFDVGSLGFRGVDHLNQVNESRNNFGAFTDLNYDISDEFLLGASARFDSYSDVGSQVSYKANARYKFGEKGAVRASYGTNFRAPALQQSFLNYGGILNTSQREAQQIEDLKAETSTNLNVGLFFNPMKNLTLSLDYYMIDIDDRVVLANNGSGNDFFTNAINTSTTGIDFSAKYDNIRFPKGVLGFTLAANWNATEINGDTTKPITMAMVDIFNRTERSRIETGRPNIKGFFGAKYEMDKFSVALNNTYYGDVTWSHMNDENVDQTFGAKFVTDILLNYKYSKIFSLNLSVNNLLNTYPDEIDNYLDFAGRFVYPYQVSQFGINGMNVRGGITARF